MSETPPTRDVQPNETGGAWEALYRNGETWLNVRDSFGCWKQLLAAFDDPDQYLFSILKILEEEHNIGLGDGKLRLACKAALEELEAYADPKPMVANRRLAIKALRDALTSSASAKPTVTTTEEKEI